MTPTEKQKVAAPVMFCSHALCAIFGLAVVPGYTLYLIAALLMGALAFSSLRSMRGKRLFSISAIVAVSSGFAVRKVLHYDKTGLNEDVAFACLLALIGFIYVLFSIYQYELANNAPDEAAPGQA